MHREISPLSHDSWLIIWLIVLRDTDNFIIIDQQEKLIFETKGHNYYYTSKLEDPEFLCFSRLTMPFFSFFMESFFHWFRSCLKNSNRITSKFPQDFSGKEVKKWSE